MDFTEVQSISLSTSSPFPSPRLLHQRLSSQLLTMSTTNTRPSSSVTSTITLEEPGNSQQTLVLRLNPRKKKVTWKEGTVDNEFMGRKSSKKCCIFHKQKSFDEDASDDEHEHDHDHDHHDHNFKGAGQSSSSN